jgi:hypothetical protein
MIADDSGVDQSESGGAREFDARARPDRAGTQTGQAAASAQLNYGGKLQLRYPTRSGSLQRREPRRAPDP